MKKRKTWVIKVGSRVLVKKEGSLDTAQIRELTALTAGLKRTGLDIILVTSGAIAAGMAELGMGKRPRDISGLQACAAVGQGRLIEIYSRLFKKKGYISAQILLTADDFRSRKRFLNARNTMLRLLDDNVIPVINENDTVIVDEIRFGDNDRLSALAANMVHAERLIILTTVDGLCDIEGNVIKEVRHITKDVEDLCHRGKSYLGTGGMRTKLESASMVTRAGGTVVIANGRKKAVLNNILKGREAGTFFAPRAKRMPARERWLAFFTKARGDIVIDKGAEDALLSKGKSLLAGGIKNITGNFRAGDPVNILNITGKKIGCGLVNYGRDELEKIKGVRTSRIADVLGYKITDEVIHRNNLSIA